MEETSLTFTASSQTGIWLTDTSGTNKHIIFASAGTYSPSWLPDGQWIAFSDGGEIYKIKLNGDSLTQLTTNGSNFFPAWSTNGLWIAYNKSLCDGPNTCGIWLMTSNGINHRCIADYGNYPDWHLNGEYIMYLIRSVTQKGEVLGDSLWVYNIYLNSKSFLVFLDGKNYENRYPRYSHDGTKIAFTSQPYGGKLQIWTMNSDGTDLKQLTYTQGYSCNWSPSGKWIVYTDSGNVSGRLWLMRSDGTANQQLTF
jgi:TolB protein